MFLFGHKKTIGTTRPAIGAIQIQTSTAGLPIPIVFGTNRISPNIFYYNDFKSIATEQQQSGGGKGGGGGGNKTTTYAYYATVMLGLCCGVVADIGRIWKDKEVTAFSSSPFTAFYGTSSQAYWTYFDTNHNADMLNYKDLAYVAAQDYQLTDSAALQNHSFEVSGLYRAGDLYSFLAGKFDAVPSDILLNLITNSHWGVGLDGLVVSDLTGGGSFSNGSYFNYCVANDLLLSPAYTDQRRAADMITDIMKITNSEIFFSEGVFKVVPYGDEAVTAHGYTYDPSANIQSQYDFTDDDYLSNDKEPPVLCTRKSQADTYNHVQIEYLDRSNNYIIAIATAEDLSSIDMYGRRTKPVVRYHAICDAQTAKNVAQLILQRDLYIRNTYEFTVTGRHFLLEPMDIVTITDTYLGLDKQPVRITETEESEDYSIKIVAEEYPAKASTHSLYSNQNGLGYNVDYNVAPGNINTPVIFEMPNIVTQSDFEIWVAISGGVNYGGCEVWASWDNATYKRIGTFHGNTRMGTLTANFASHADPDNVNTLSIDLTTSRGALISANAEDRDRFRTLCYVGGELISFKTATLTAQYKYDIVGATSGNGIRRGVYGTTIGAHNTGSDFVRIDNVIFKCPFDEKDIGKTIYLKFLAFNIYSQALQGLGDVSAYTHVISDSPLRWHKKRERPAGRNIRKVSADYSIDADTDRYVMVNTTNNPGSPNIVVTLPSFSTPGLQTSTTQEYKLKNTGTGNMTVSGTVDGVSNPVVGAGQSMIVVYSSDDSEYKKIGENATSGGTSVVCEIDKFTGNGTQTQFTTSVAFYTNSLSVFLNGVLQERSVDYTEDAGKTYFTFTAAPPSGGKIEARYLKG